MIPVIALVGRPNVGKSTLFNRLTRSRDALVANFPGLTRDRQYGEAIHGDRPFIVVDTGGITGEEIGIDSPMAQQSLAAIEEADIVLMMVDARDGLMGIDQELAATLRIRGKPTQLVVNKIDGVNEDVVTADFFQLGIAQIHPIAASQGRGIQRMLDILLADFPAIHTVPTDTSERGIKIGVVGRPNVGKSTLVNRLLGEERVVVYDEPGTTRDSVYIDYQRDGKDYTLIDTAGIRRRKNIREVVEKFSIVKTLKAIDDANVVVLMMDASEGIVDQDLHLLGHVMNVGRGLVLAVNKWDGLETDVKENIRSELKRRLQFIDYADIHTISALHGTGVGNLYKSIDAAYRASTHPLQTTLLNRILEGALRDHQPPTINGRRIKLRYAHAGGHNPPIIVIHGNQTDKVPESYKRFLEKTFRRELKLEGTPIRIEFKGSVNPFREKQAEMTDRQRARERRLKAHKPNK
ncbi:MAG: GTP-binding protein [Halieaceae bacterium]|jgi:GTP-binding protein